MSEHIISKLLDWECRAANEESETLMEAVSYIDQLEKELAEAKDLSKSYLRIADGYADRISNLLNRAEKAEKELELSNKRIATLEETIRYTGKWYTIDEYQKLKAELSRYREALEWISLRDRYGTTGHMVYGECGKVALKALAKEEI